MMPQLDERYADALRQLLVAQVQRTAIADARPNKLRSRLAAVGAALILAAAGGGIAYATGAFTSLPGATTTTPLAAAIEFSGTGTKTIDLGPRPKGANAVSLAMTCLSVGTIRFPSSGSMECTEPLGDTNDRTASVSIMLAPGQHTLAINATRGMRWRVVANYSLLTSTRWKVNARGQTYGATNRQGMPDLVATHATNGRDGYV